MVSPRPSCISAPVSITTSPPSWRIATSKLTRVRVLGFSKIIASVLPASGRDGRAARRLEAGGDVQHLPQRRGVVVAQVEEVARRRVARLPLVRPTAARGAR